MSTFNKGNILNLSVAERILLVEDIWDSVAEIPESVELSDTEKAELDERLALYHNNPDSGSPWGMVKERIKSKYGALLVRRSFSDGGKQSAPLCRI